MRQARRSWAWCSTTSSPRAGLAARDQQVRTAPQRLPNPCGRGDEHIRLARLDFANITDVDVDEFRQTGLGHAEGNTFAPDIFSENSELGIFADASWHVAHRKNLGVDQKDTAWPNLPTLSGSSL